MAASVYSCFKKKVLRFFPFHFFSFTLIVLKLYLFAVQRLFLSMFFILKGDFKILTTTSVNNWVASTLIHYINYLISTIFPIKNMLKITSSSFQKIVNTQSWKEYQTWSNIRNYIRTFCYFNTYSLATFNHMIKKDILRLPAKNISIW